MRHPRTFLAAAFCLGLVAVGCDAVLTDVGRAAASSRAAPAGPDVLHVAAGHQTFELSRREIASGWTTVRFQNASDAPHFVILEKMPVVDGEQKTLEDSEAEVVPVFQNIMDSFRDEAPSFPDAGFELPAWYSEVVFLGGPGLTSPGETSETRVHLEPGVYLIECYVKTADGVFHSVNGMIEQLVVNGASNGSAEPAAVDGHLTISSSDGITVESAPSRPGSQVIRVDFEDQAVYANFLGHDVHLVRLEAEADREALGTWMNWAVPGGLAGDAPAGVTFLGGAQDMPAGSTTYLRAKLTPGDYAWIAEVPDPAAKGMLVEFTVP